MAAIEKSCSNITKGLLKNGSTNDEASEVKFLPSVKQSLKNIVAKEGFTSHEISQKLISSNGSNYLGDLYEVEIKGKTKDGPKEIHIFLKQVISDEGILKSIVNVETCYSSEVLVYTELVDIFSTLQDNVNVPEGERFKIVKSYECVSEAIFLENIAKKGFKTLNRMDVMPLKFAELSIAQLAKLHGLTFVLKHKRPDYFEKKIKSLEPSVVFDDIIGWKNYAQKMFEITTNHFDRGTKEKIDYFLQHSFYNKFPKYSKGETGSVKCMCHGDFRISNIMVKEIADEEKEVVLIDYQFLFYGSPLVDFFYFLYTGTDREFRKAHMNNLKDLYHNKLTEFLKYFHLDINDIYAKKDFEKDFKDSLDFGLMVSLYVSPIIFIVVEQEVPYCGKNTVNDVPFKMDDRYKERVTEVVEEYMEWGILK
ncbi:uncharacterized protein LOC123868400 [Maniola jurtina]|uniref:uncharacterized protein LOC123868400 n=1 Tax=Maniola jurtina TaxID=191418 RepID=UPI001E685CBB|nr:uncharacterized protein LOC123868400 [Maniola jurtina]